jgi:hypothetical protein
MAASPASIVPLDIMGSEKGGYLLLGALELLDKVKTPSQSAGREGAMGKMEIGRDDDVKLDQLGLRLISRSEPNCTVGKFPSRTTCSGCSHVPFSSPPKPVFLVLHRKYRYQLDRAAWVQSSCLVQPRLVLGFRLTITHHFTCLPAIYRAVCSHIV